MRRPEGTSGGDGGVEGEEGAVHAREEQELALRARGGAGEDIWGQHLAVPALLTGVGIEADEAAGLCYHADSVPQEDRGAVDGFLQVLVPERTAVSGGEAGDAAAERDGEELVVEERGGGIARGQGRGPGEAAVGSMNGEEAMLALSGDMGNDD